MTRLKEPYFVTGKVVKGFGRGSKQLGCPTANLESQIVNQVELENGIYYGFARLCIPESESDDSALNHKNASIQVSSKPKWSPIYNMVCSLGWNPHFDNKVRSLEAHILHEFGYDFYGAQLKVAICGLIREEKKFNSLEELIQAIQSDIQITKNELKDESKWKQITENVFFQIHT